MRKKGLNWDAKKQAIRTKARKNWPTTKIDPEMMGFLGLYWGEGSKSLGRNKQVCIVNSDPGIIKLSAKIFRRLDPNAKIEAIIRYYPDNDAEACQKCWVGIVNPSKVRMIERVDLRPTKRKLEFGTCTIRFSNWRVYHTILEWLDCWKDEI
jgi:hypothetical protein